MRWPLALAGLVAIAPALGCFHVDPIQEASRPFKEADRAREAGRWAGTYRFSECASGGAPCFTYEVTVTADGNAMVTVDAADKPPQLKAKPRVHNDALDLSFESYADESVDIGDVGFKVLDPLRGRFSPGQPLATITRDAGGRPCLNFASLESRLGTKTLCVPESRP